MNYRPSPDFIIAVIIIALVIAAALYLVGAIFFWQSAVAAPVSHSSVTLTRPQICAEYYNNGTDEWINCMGVEYK